MIIENMGQIVEVWAGDVNGYVERYDVGIFALDDIDALTLRLGSPLRVSIVFFTSLLVLLFSLEPHGTIMCI